MAPNKHVIVQEIVNIIHCKTAMKTKREVKHLIWVQRKQVLRLFTVPYFSVRFQMGRHLGLGSMGAKMGRVQIPVSGKGWWG